MLFSELFGVDDVKNKLDLFLSILFCVATLFMGVGYASINSISLNVTGDVQPQLQNGIYITSVEYLNSNYVDINKSKIINAYQNNLNSNIVLSENPNSSISILSIPT